MRCLAEILQLQVFVHMLLQCKTEKRLKYRYFNTFNQMQNNFKFFDRKSFIIMACMMTMGIGFRATGICPPVFIAVFYTGLGAALTLAGVRFAYTYIQHLRVPAAEREPEP